MNDKISKNHPLEELLEIEAGSTPMSTNPFIDEDIESLDTDENEEFDNSMEEVLAAAPPHPDSDFYDSIDKDITKKYNNIYAQAMDAFGRQIQDADLVEGRFRARNLEVAAQFLKIGLDSAKDAATQKANKDKLKVAENKADGNGGNTQNNFFIGDRNDLLKMLSDDGDSDPKIINEPSDESE